MTKQLTAARVATARSVERLVNGQFVMDGAGVKINRVLTQTLQRRLDPFLMLDAFGSEKPGDYIAGFPEHPHRGFETISYMITGSMRHRDSAGHEGLITNGGVQWMTAGRGVIHSEMPEQSEGMMEGFQLWLNLPARDKMSAPWYRDIPNQEIPRFGTDSGATVQVIAGRSHGVEGAVQRDGTEPYYLDIELAAGATFEQQLPPGHNAFLYVFRGEVTVEGKGVARTRLAILTNPAGAEGVRIKAAEASRVLLIAGRPLGEPIAQYGPFVMNTQDELRQAVEDFRAGTFGS
ncbi:pirin family protein [Massilia sp. TWR1-2-2]|uniref:pirin family protein n=1 Tax=Massilia sp. TWR1-2-2 TaxID=2804584 RepID=UPI003CF128CC